jgi:hypothetical protein
MTRDEGFRRLAMALDKEDDVVYKYEGNTYVVEKANGSYAIYVAGNYIGAKSSKSDAIALCKKRAQVDE